MDVTAAIINRLKADPRTFAKTASYLVPTTDFNTTAPSTTTITMITDQSMLYPVGSVIGVTVSSVVKFTKVKTITPTLLTVEDVVLSVGAGAITAIGYARVSRATNTPFPQLPSVVVQKIDDLRSDHTSTGKYSTARIQCSSYAKTDSEADEVSELIADALDATVNTVIGSLSIVSCFDAGVVPDSDPKVPLFVYHRDFMIKYSVRI